MGIQERKQREKERRKQEIVDAAEQIFFKKGYHTTTIEEISELAELSKGTIYLYFQNKEDVFYEIRNRAFRLLYETFKSSFNEEISGYENVIGIARSYIEYADKYKNYFKIISYFDFQDSQTSQTKRNGNSGGLSVNPMEFLAKAIQLGIEDKTIRKDIMVNALGYILWSQTSGLLQFLSNKQNYLSKLGIDKDNLIDAYLNIFSKGIQEIKDNSAPSSK